MVNRRIYGDLAQSLYSYRSINSWEEITNIFDKPIIKNLNKSYRTTIEIMNEANKINRKLNLNEALPVIRHGDEVEYSSKDIIDILKDLKNNYNSIAIITKKEDEALEVYNEIKNKIDIKLITVDDLNYTTSINILPSYLSKGLEFDAVIIIDKNNSFNKESKNDLKMLYVSMTRALHKLVINI